MKLTYVLALAGALVGLQANAAPADEYFHSPAEKILCTIRAQNPDGSRDAVGTDLTNPKTFVMQTVRVDANGNAQKSWVIDRATYAVSEGGYNVFRTHCAPLLKQVPPEVSGLYTTFFAS